ncbi:polysaccharide biosynthesis protein [Lactiplantibacillus garii]|uniref:Polysaccharide biosynthesis protein n=1 Tax=Lactiplantibacillus garii TaxID=2306423 RepID=A0A426D4I7_9LACO|nr:polysaccharide biosynthesis protein [Lactiplantibacillus garii]RRK09474.1 polysaccharide biosynthesis protein [Lactiplantibacillus garii]
MKYGGKERLRLAWRWLPVELLVIAMCGAIGLGLTRLMSKTVYQARFDIKVERRLSKRANDQQRQRQLKKDVKNVGQFSVMPHQGNVLVAANNYAYSHYGISQQIQDLGEAVTAAPVTNQPILRVTVTSSSRVVAQQNSKAFQDAIGNTLKPMSGYQVTLIPGKTKLNHNVMLKPMLKFFGVVGVSLALLSPYVVKYVRGEGRDGDA